MLSKLMFKSGAAKPRMRRTILMTVLSLFLAGNLSSASHDENEVSEEVYVYQVAGFAVGYAYWFYDEFSDFISNKLGFISDFPAPPTPPDTGGGGRPEPDCGELASEIGSLISAMEGVNGMMNASSIHHILEFDPETGQIIAEAFYKPGSRQFTDSLADKIRWKRDAEKRLDDLFNNAASACKEP